MISALVTWWKKYFTDPEAAYLLFFITLGILVITMLSNILGPILASLIVAYVLDSAVVQLMRWKVKRKLAVVIVYLLFMAAFVLSLVALFPLISRQLTNLVTEIPAVANKIQLLSGTVHSYFPFISQAQIDQILLNIKVKVSSIDPVSLSLSLNILPNLFSIALYVVMVPLLVYFFLMDKQQLLKWLGSRFVPTHHRVLTTVWKDLHKQIANYLRGRVIEAVIVMIVTFISFLILGLQYALLLAALVGISVFIPYIGVIIVTIPVVIVGVLQWGFTDHLWTLLIVYAVIVTLDGNLLMPLLFSGAVSLHPIAIILAILVFGGIWGIGGMFFAIPLAALVKALIENWPVTKVKN